MIVHSIHRRETNRVLSSACNRGNDGDGIGFLDRSRVLAQVANVLIVQIDIDEGSQLAVFGEQMLAQIGMLGNEIVQASPTV
jgi:hypothetical protein